MALAAAAGAVDAAAGAAGGSAAAADNVQAARNLAFIAARRKQYGVADKWFIEALRLAPGDAGMHFNHGYVLEQDGRAREAIAAFAEAVRLNSSFDLAWFGLGMAQARLGEHAEAAAAFAKAAELQPMNGEAFYQWAMACHHAHQPERVAEIAKRLAGFEPKRALKLIKDAERPDLPRLTLAFNHKSVAKLRRLVDDVNKA